MNKLTLLFLILLFSNAAFSADFEVRLTSKNKMGFTESHRLFVKGVAGTAKPRIFWNGKELDATDIVLARNAIAELLHIPALEPQQCAAGVYTLKRTRIPLRLNDRVKKFHGCIEDENYEKISVAVALLGNIQARPR